MRLKLDVQNSRQRADHQRLGQAGHAFQQAMAAGENGGEHLLDDVVLPDDDLLQFLLHQPPMLAELLQNVSQAARFGSGRLAVEQGQSLSQPAKEGGLELFRFRQRRSRCEIYSATSGILSSYNRSRA